MIPSLINPMMRSSTRPLSTLSPASLSSAGTGLARATEQMRKVTRIVLIIFRLDLTVEVEVGGHFISYTLTVDTDGSDGCLTLHWGNQFK